MTIKLIQNCYNKDAILSLLSELTTTPPLDDYTYNKIINAVTYNNFHNIFVYIIDDKPVGMITTIIEQKLIHGGKCVAHIEDLIVDKEFRNRGVAKELLNHVIRYINSQNCYKIILNCKKELIPFYNKYQFKEECVQMRHNINDNNVEYENENDENDENVSS